MGFKKAVLGLSGGIDSAVVLCIAAAALGKENVHAVLLPSMYSSDHSVNDALELVKNLGCSHDIIPIKDVYNTFLSTLEPVFKNLPHDLAEENLQARARGMILMALSNKFGYILLNTSNKSEMAVGYGTLYGDMCGGLAVIGDLYKREVYELARFINLQNEIIPENIIIKAPSAELRPDQKDSDSLPEYDILDEILFEFIENRKGEAEIIQLGYEPSVVKRILKLIDNSEWKRKQAPPVLRISDKAFGLGRRIPIVGKFMV
jgi:NAD+ synthase (glutamine-hydrolysing)